MKCTVEVDLLQNEALFCDTLAEMLGVEFSEEEAKLIFKRRNIIAEKPEKTGKFLTYLSKVLASKDTAAASMNLYSQDITLTEYQRSVLLRVGEALSTEKFVVLAGYAGVGKTTLLRFLSELGYKSVQYLAPTNKAAAVLSKKLGPDAVCITIHKWLKITPKQDKDTIEWRQFDRSKLLASLSKLDLVVIDEASMLNTSLLEILEEHILSALSVRTRVLFVGDNFQLPPVEETKSPVFKYPTVRMKKIVRQAEDSPIIKASMEIRQAIKERDTASMVRSLDVFARASEPDYALFSELRENPNSVRMIAHRNNTVSALNKKVQNYLGVPGKRELRETDLATAYSPIFLKQDLDAMLSLGLSCTDNFIPKFFISDDFWVEGLESKVIQNPRVEYDYKKQHRSLTLGEVSEDNNLYVTEFTLKHVETGNVFQTYMLEDTSVLNRVAATARAAKEPALVTGAWKLFWNLKALSDLKAGYALTCHKVQGSTFDTVIIDLEDILSCRSVQTVGRLLYVSVTRAAKNVIIL